MLFIPRQFKYVLMIAFCSLFFSSAVQAKLLTQEFSIPPIDGSPLSVQIPFNISTTGSITVTVKIEVVGLLDEKTVLAGLYQKNRRYVLLSKYLDARSQTLHLRHDVEGDEFAKGGEYYLSLTNYSRAKEVKGDVQIAFPVAGEKVVNIGEELLPDLAITDIRLDERCRVQVSLKNHGPGIVQIYYWRKYMPQLSLFKDDQLWGGVDIRFFDYQQKLSPVGGETVYSSGLKVIGSAKIRALVESHKLVAEADKTNNSKEVELTCK